MGGEGCDLGGLEIDPSALSCCVLARLCFMAHASLLCRDSALCKISACAAELLWAALHCGTFLHPENADFYWLLWVTFRRALPTFFFCIIPPLLPGECVLG